MAATAPVMLIYTATQGSETATQSFTITIYDPLVLPRPQDQTFTRGIAIPRLLLPAATGGTGAPVAYQLLRLDGSSLPPGLSFDPTDRTLSGTPTTVITTPPVTLTYTATQGSVTAPAQTFTITVEVLTLEESLENLTYIVGRPIPDLEFPGVIGGDSNLGMTYQLVDPLRTLSPPGLNFDEATRTYTGTPTEATDGPVTLIYNVTQGSAAVAQMFFTITIHPDLALPQPQNQTFTVGIDMEPVVLLAATGGDGSAVTYAVTGLPSWLTFNPETRTLSGTPTEATTAPVPPLTYTATQANTVYDSLTDSQTFTITVNDPLVLPRPQNQTFTVDIATESEALLAATGGDGSEVTYAVTGLPSWLSFNASTRTLTGTPTEVTTAPVSLTYTATQGSVDGCPPRMFTITVING